MSFDLQPVRGVYERIVIDAMAPVPVFVENQVAVNFDALDEYCLVRINFGEVQAPVVGYRSQWHIRGSLVCEIYTRKGIGPGRGMQIAAPAMSALTALNDLPSTDTQEIIARVGAASGPTQDQLTPRPHHFTRFSFPIRARCRPVIAPHAPVP